MRQHVVPIGKRQLQRRHESILLDGVSGVFSARAAL
jgi:hypothetical protein